MSAKVRRNQETDGSSVMTLAPKGVYVQTEQPPKVKGRAWYDPDARELRTVRDVITVIYDYEIQERDDVILCDASASDLVITLPLASIREKQYDVKKIDISNNSVTIIPAYGSDDLVEREIELVLLSPGDSVPLVSDLTDWHVL